MPRKPAKSEYYYDGKDDDVSWPTGRIKLNYRHRRGPASARAMAAAGASGLLEWANSSARKRRRDIYHQKLSDNPKAKRIVSEGDSWHLYPEVIDEVIDQLNKDRSLAIFSCDGAADTLDSIWAERQDSNKGFVKSIAMEKPSVFLFCGGGNDLLHSLPGPDGKKIGNLYFHLKDFSAGMSAEQLVKPTIEPAYDAVEAQFRAMVSKALEFSSIKKVVFHDYAYPFPANDVWLGKPMGKRGIVSASLQRQICVILMDKLHSRLSRVAQSFAGTGRVTYVDVRDCVPNKSEWHDELHPTSAGFKRVAARIKPAL